MKERLLTLAGAALAFYMVYMLLLPKPAPFEPKISIPTTQDRGQYGLAAASRWLQQAGIHTLSLRDRYQQLYADPELPREGNLLIMSLPYRMPSRDWEEQQLLTWLQEGNSVLILAALSDWPEWAPRNSSSVSQVLELLGLQLGNADEPEPDKDQKSENNPDNKTGQQEPAKPEADSAPDKPDASESRYLVPAFTGPYTHRITQVQAEWKKSEGLKWRLEGVEEQRSLLVLLQDKQSKTPALWLGRVGNGRVIISRHADLFGNVSLGHADNARLLADLVDSSLGEDGYVIFDDMHQGLSAVYDPDAFFDDSRLHHTLWFILLLWLVYLLGHTNRFQPVTNKPRQLHLVDHIRAIGNFMARRLRPAAVAQRMLMHFFNDIRRYHGLPRNGQPVWDKLSGYQQLDSRELAQLKTFYQQTERQESLDLVKLDQLIKSIRKKLL